MLDSLSLLVIVFVAMSVAAVIGIVLLFVMKNEKKKYIVYFMAALGMYIAWANAQSVPLPEYLGEAILGWIFGALGVAGLLLQVCGKTEKHLVAAKILVVISVAAGIMELFLH